MRRSVLAVCCFQLLALAPLAPCVQAQAAGNPEEILFRDLQAERVWQDVAAWVPRAKAGAPFRSCRSAD